MRISNALVLTLLATSGSLPAGETVGVPGSAVRFPTQVQVNVVGKSVPLTLTGTALRSRFVVNVYSIASYVQTGTSVQTAEQLARANCVRQLHLVLERDLSGKDLAEAFRTAVRANYPEPAFNHEVLQLTQTMNSLSVQKGEHITLTHIPGVGLHCSVPGKTDFTIKNPQFSDAVWDIYLGARNLGDHIKKGLTSRL